MDEIRFVAGVIIGRYQDRVEADRQAALKAHEEAAAKKREEAAAKKKAEDEAKKAAEPAKTNGDSEMKDADAETIKPDSVEEPPAAK
jgi:heat shock protein 4